MTPQELINSLSGEDGIALVGYESVIILCDGELYDVESVTLEDGAIILMLNDGP